MQRKIKVLNLYSDMNQQIDFIIVIENEKELERAEQIIEEAYTNWFDLETNPELQHIPIAEYIQSQLKRKGIEFEWYVKQEEQEDVQI